jgi:hypothetical protein
MDFALIAVLTLGQSLVECSRFAAACAGGGESLAAPFG